MNIDLDDDNLTLSTMFFLPLEQNIFRQPIPENTLPYQTFYLEYPYEKKNKKIVLTPYQSTLKYGTKNRPWPKGLIT